jgi:hypothetical protein
MTVASVLTDLLSVLSEKNIDQVLPVSYLEGKIREGQRDFARALQDHWSVTRCLGIKYRQTMSRVKYQALRNSLSSLWDEHIGAWATQVFNGVPFPRMPGRRAMEKRVEKLKSAYGWVLEKSGLVAIIDLQKKIEMGVQESLRRGYFTETKEGGVVDKFGEVPEVQAELDAALMHKGMKQTAFAFHLPHGTDHPCAPDETHTFGLTEGGDGWDDVRDLGAKILLAMNKLIKHPMATFKTEDGRTVETKVPVNFFHCRADLLFFLVPHSVTTTIGEGSCGWRLSDGRGIKLYFRLQLLQPLQQSTRVWTGLEQLFCLRAELT